MLLELSNLRFLSSYHFVPSFNDLENGVLRTPNHRTGCVVQRASRSGRTAMRGDHWHLKSNLIMKKMISNGALNAVVSCVRALALTAR